jgi:hypothetical protein
MRKLVAALAAVPFLLSAGSAMADQVIGVVEKIDPGTQTIWVKGNPYHLEDGVVPLKFAEIKVGDKVRLEYNSGGGATSDVYEADRAK